MVQKQQLGRCSFCTVQAPGSPDFCSSRSHSHAAFLFCLLHRALPSLPPLLFALMSPVGVLIHRNLEIPGTSGHRGIKWPNRVHEMQDFWPQLQSLKMWNTSSFNQRFVFLSGYKPFHQNIEVAFLLCGLKSYSHLYPWQAKPHRVYVIPSYLKLVLTQKHYLWAGFYLHLSL